jgi:hypothetical protein
MKLDLSGTTSGGSSESDPMQMQLNGTATSQNGETVLASAKTGPVGILTDCLQYVVDRGRDRLLVHSIDGFRGGSGQVIRFHLDPFSNEKRALR